MRIAWAAPFLRAFRQNSIAERNELFGISLTSWFGRDLLTSEIGTGYGDEALIRSPVATRTKEVGGDTTFAGLIRFGSSIYGARNARKVSFAEILAELELKRTENTLGI
jgi:hypothetical protein